jgi:hypothetical protein
VAACGGGTTRALTARRIPQPVPTFFTGTLQTTTTTTAPTTTTTTTPPTTAPPMTAPPTTQTHWSWLDGPFCSYDDEAKIRADPNRQPLRIPTGQDRNGLPTGFCYAFNPPS